MKATHWLIAICFVLMSVPSALTLDNTDTAIDDPRFEEVVPLLQSGEYEQVLELLSKIEQDYPADPNIPYYQALTHFFLTDYDAAIEAIDEAIDFARDDPEQIDGLVTAYILRAETGLRQDEIEQALADYEHAVTIQPDNIYIYVSRGRYYETVKSYELALEDYQRALELDNEIVDLYIAHANVAMQLNDLDTALNSMNTAVEITPEDAELYIIRAKIFVAQEEKIKAAEDYKSWLERITEEDIISEPLSPQGGEHIELEMALGTVYHLPFEAYAGQILYVVANGRSVDALVIVLDPDGNPLIADDDSGGGVNAFIQNFEISQTGEYMLLVGHARGGFDGIIDLTVETSNYRSA